MLVSCTRPMVYTVALCRLQFVGVIGVIMIMETQHIVVISSCVCRGFHCFLG